MQKATAVIDDVNDLKWPRKCPGCARDVAEEAPSTTDVRVEKDVRALFAISTPTALSVKLCDACSRKMSKYAFLDKFEKTTVWLIIVVLALITYIGSTFKTENVLLKNLDIPLWFFFWTVFLLSYLNGIRQKRIVGVRCLRKSKDRWTFRFRNDAFGTEFAALNPHVK